MADVTPTRRRERGQVILVLGLAIAAIFVALAVLLNGAIYAENLASRGGDADSRGPIEFQRSIVEGVGGLLDAENGRLHATNASVRENASGGIAVIEAVMTRRHAARGIAADVSGLALHEGALLGQSDASRNLSGADGSADWTLATDLRDLRGFRLNVTGGLNATADPAGGFRVLVDGASNWSLAVYENGSAVELAIRDGGGWSKGVCAPPASPPVELDLTAGTVDGRSCPALQFAAGVTPPFDLAYRNGGEATGTFEVTVNVSGSGAVRETNLNGPGDADAPFYARAVYDATLSLEYESPAVTYATRVRIAPGETDD